MTDQITTPTAEVVERLTRAAMEPREVSTGIYLVPTEGGTIDFLDTVEVIEKYADRPRRKKGIYRVTLADHLREYLAKHAGPDAEMWGDIDKATITAVVNAPGASSPAWSDHRIVLQLRHTDDWKDWTSGDKKMMSQTEFAEFLEQHAPNIVSPDAATMLELAQTFKAATKVDFESSRRVKSGETQLVYRENTEASAGRRGELAIPDAIRLGVQVYEGGVVYALNARFRYRIVDGALALGYVLERPRDVLRDAFGAICDWVADETGTPVWQGSPA